MDRDTLPPTSADDAALEYGRKLAAEVDTGALAVPGSTRFKNLEQLVPAKDDTE